MLFLKKVRGKTKILRKEVENQLARWQGRSVVHFLHIGKTGGSALKAAIKPHIDATEAVIRFRYHSIKLRDIPRGDKVIFFFRDLASRFVSAFYFRKFKGGKRYPDEWTHREKVAFSFF